MPKIEVCFDLERSKKIFAEYFDYYKLKTFKKFPVLWVILITVLFIGLGSFFKNEYIQGIGIIMALIIIINYTYYYFYFEFQKKKHFKELESYDIENERNYYFIFDENEIKYESINSNRSINWELIKAYERNKDHIYLYFENQTLFDIICLEIMGKEHFDYFLNLIDEKQIICLNKSRN